MTRIGHKKMFHSSSDKKSELVKNAKAERELRLEKKKKETSVIKIQSCIRMFLCKRKFRRGIREDFDTFFKTEDDIRTALSIFSQARRLILIFDNDCDVARFVVLCKAISKSLDAGKEPKYWFMSVMLMKEWTSLWVKNIKQILNLCAHKLKLCKTYIRSGSNAASVYLAMLVTFTNCTNWKILKIKGGENIRPVMHQLCLGIVQDLVAKGLLKSLQGFLMDGLAKTNISLTHASLFASTTLIVRGLNVIDESHGIMMFVTNILTLPGYIYHLSMTSTDSLQFFEEQSLLGKTLHSLCVYDNMSNVYKNLDADESLALIGNLINLSRVNEDKFAVYKESLKIVLSGLLKHCKSFLGRHASNSKFHPILGWYNDMNPGRSTNDAYIHVLTQLRYLWKKPLIGHFFESLPTLEESEIALSPQESESRGSLLRKAFMRTFKKGSFSENINLNEPVVADICSSCDLYRTLAKTLAQFKMEIVAGLSLQEEILVQLWRFLYSLNIPSVIKQILAFFLGESQALGRPISSLLILFCECTSQLIPILDDFELYEKQKPFTCDDLIKMSSFLNTLVFKLIWLDSNQVKSLQKLPENDDTLKRASLDLLLLLYDRDCRKSFTPSNHWLSKEIKVSHFLNELRDRKERARILLDNIPHVLPHMERVKVFHGWVSEDKNYLGIDKEYSRPSAVVSIRRSRLLEDGYEQLSQYQGTQLKGIIRVKFVNEQGLDEAGIDQDGVFKEFLEDVISEAFNPQLNLFKMTIGADEQNLYPSPTSFIHSNYLHLFEFVGKMLGKAIYEGILVDVRFASFFLNSILRRNHSAMYSSIDELPSLDPEMHKHLNFIKNYDGDVSDLDLVFAYDEDMLGQMVTHDLKPGGRAISVTNTNKFSYIHLMAMFRIHTQIKEVSAAFISGFYSIISPEWLSIFSSAELQHLISGDSGKIDLNDLRNNCRYFGGYHSSHPAIIWLWDILINDFTLAEKKSFLKFVTSCSNPPLLGFKYLEPQFSIRFVDCSEDEDEGDSVGSVVRGLFNVRKKGPSSSARLPTASTCFNLLKLPCYKKKSILKEKLRYAIKSGAGFELS